MFDERARGSLRGIRGPLAVLVVLAMMLQTAGQAYAAGTLDQSQPSVNPSNGTAFVLTQEPLLITAQTFTAGLTGNLDQVGLAIAHAGRTASNANIEIRTVSGGVPTSTVIGSGTVLAANVPQATIGVGISMLLAPLATPAPVVAGTQYAIVLR